MKEQEKENRIVSMNDEQYGEMFLEELEERLETDPLLPGGLLSVLDGGEVAMDDCPCHAGIRDECTCNSGTLIECPCNAKTLIV